ncbi:FtsX-like permease family protein [Micromonospora sp. NPDC049523]|uniref:FtsX-like permease family protein n=1 Tax=Micromonospora sp. NPDC049523 TaxID=3155921 RepID=UPI003433F544
MLGLVLSAIRVRRAQAAILFVLTGLAVAAATAAPWYVLATARTVALAQVEGADPRFLAARATGSVVKPPAENVTGEALLTVARTSGARALTVPGTSPTVALRYSGNAASPTGKVRLTIAYRDRVCSHLLVDGACPDGPGQAVLSRRTAELLQVGLGAEVVFEAGLSGVLPVRVVGLYELRDPVSPYWALSESGGVVGNESSATSSGDSMFVTAATMAALPLREINADYHLELPASAFLRIDGYDLVADVARQGQQAGSWRVETNARRLAERVYREQDLLNLGVTVAAVQLLLVCWFALYFAVRHTAEQRRSDIGLVKLRGGARWRVSALVMLQSALPMVTGALVGVGLGVLAARQLHSAVADPGRSATATALSLAAAGTALVGALVAVVFADSRAIGSGVVELLRHVPPRRRGWRADVVDLVLVAVAGAGIYQAMVTDPEPGGATGLVLVAPALVAVVLALVAGRLLGPLGVRAGRRALRAGRLPVLLAALQVARRPGTHRIFALMTVAVAIFATAVTGWSASEQARDRRSAQELGADRVLTVQVRNRAHLLAAVRAADPGGTHAMAVVRNSVSGGNGQTMLAVDSPRFERVVTGQPEYAPAGTRDLVGLLRPAVPESVLVPDGILTLDLTAVASQVPSVPGREAPPLLVIAQLVDAGGDPVPVLFGPVTTGRADYRAPAAGCGTPASAEPSTAPAGCRLVGFDLASRNSSGELITAAGRTVELHGLTGPAGPVLTAALLGDPLRWRAQDLLDLPAPMVAARPGGLTVTTRPEIPTGALPLARAYLIDAPVPLPVLETGRTPVAVPGDPRLRLFGGTAVPIRVGAAARALPQVPGNGLLVDLEYADRLAAGGFGDEPQVWLAPDAPDDLPDRLRAEGLTIVDTESTGAVQHRLARQGPPSTLRFQLLAGAIGLLLAAGALTVAAAVERDGRRADLVALRVQGLPPGAVRRVAYGGDLLLVGCAVLLGVGASVLAGALLRATMPLFVDGWGLLPTSTAPGGLAVLLAVLGALVVLGGAAATASTQLVRAVTTRGDGALRAPREAP